MALNVKLEQGAFSARTLAVNIRQAGQSAVDTTLSVMTKESDAGLVPNKNEFFERITLPASYTDAEATVRVVAMDESGAEVGMATDKVSIQPAGAVASFVTIGEAPPADDTMN